MSNTIVFNVVSTNGQNIAINTLGLDNTISDVKAKLEEMQGYPVNMICLVYKGRKLEDTTTLGAADVKAGVTLNMVLALRAG